MVSFQLAEKKIHQILYSEFTYEIPKFQREYSWEKDEVNQLLEDIFLMLKRIKDFKNITEDYFLGSLVIIDDKRDAKNKIVIDGQQRLTTIVILLNVLKEKFTNKANKKDIQKYIYANIREDKYRLKLNRTNRKFFTTFIQSFNSEEHKEKLTKELKESSNSNQLIYKAYEHLFKGIDLKIEEDKIKKKDVDEFLLKILKTIKESFTIIEMSASSLQDASLIFETLNTRSKRLQLYEIVKNHIFGRMNQKKTEIESFWSTILEEYYKGLPRNFTSSFTTNYRLIKGDNATFSYFIKKFKDKNSEEKMNYYEYSFNLRRDIEILSNLKDPTISYFKKEKQVKTLSLIRAFKVEQVNWVLLASYKMNFQFEKILEIIKTFVFKNKFSKNYPFNSRTVLAEIANKIISSDYDSSSHLEEIKARLEKLSSSMDKIKINFFEDTMADTLAKCLMMEINDIYDGKLKLEHIYAKKNESNEFEKAVRIIKRKRKFEINSISNFTLLSSKGNKDSGNNSFEDKIEIYKRSKEISISSNKKLSELFDKHNSFNTNLVKEYENFIWTNVSKIFNL